MPSNQPSPGMTPSGEVRNTKDDFYGKLASHVIQGIEILGLGHYALLRYEQLKGIDKKSYKQEAFFEILKIFFEDEIPVIAAGAKNGKYYMNAAVELYGKTSLNQSNMIQSLGRRDTDVSWSEKALIDDIRKDAKKEGVIKK